MLSLLHALFWNLSIPYIHVLKRWGYEFRILYMNSTKARIQRQADEILWIYVLLLSRTYIQYNMVLFLNTIHCVLTIQIYYIVLIKNIFIISCFKNIGMLTTFVHAFLRALQLQYLLTCMHAGLHACLDTCMNTVDACLHTCLLTCIEDNNWPYLKVSDSRAR